MQGTDDGNNDLPITEEEVQTEDDDIPNADDNDKEYKQLGDDTKEHIVNLRFVKCLS